MNEMNERNEMDWLKTRGNYIKALKYYGVSFDPNKDQQYAKCPFCHEKAESLLILLNNNGGNYYCSRCQATGILFHLVSDKEGLDYRNDMPKIIEKIKAIRDLKDEPTDKMPVATHEPKTMQLLVVPNEERQTANDLCPVPLGEEIILQSTDVASKRPWPILGKDAFFGVFGEFVNAIADCTEADPVGILVQMLSCFSNIIGSGPFYKIGATIHKLNIFTVIVGRTSRSRKGTGWDIALNVMKIVDYLWWDNKITSGLSSGEGLIVEVRDPEPDADDPGVLDKRLFVFEPEFSKVLKVTARSLNTLNDVVRQAWDTGKLNIMNKNNPVKANNALISINGHITFYELRQLLSDIDVFNGFGNRFLWFCVKRANIRPFGDDYEKIDLTPYIERIKKAVDYSKNVGRIQFDAEAHELWERVYNELSEEQPEEAIGLSDELTARAEAQVSRLACIYALSDLSDVIRPSHIKAALALWKYSEDSVKYIFGNQLSNPTTEKIKNGLKNSPNGLTRSEIFSLFSKNAYKATIETALGELSKAGLASCKKTETGGRPEERWFYTGK